MATEGSGGEHGGEYRRRDLFNVDELINIVLARAHTRAGRRLITGVCFVVVAAVVAFPIVTRSSPAPARQGDFSTLTISVPEDISQIPTSAATTPEVDVSGPAAGVNGHRFGPPLPTDTTQPPTTRPPAPTTTVPPATNPIVAPPTQPPPAPPPPTDPPPTSPPDTGVAVPYDPNP
jgi:hypothetical protein